MTYRSRSRRVRPSSPASVGGMASVVGLAIEPADKRNKLERDYGVHLHLRYQAGEILRYDFEPEKLRLADRTFYTPDYRVVLADRTIEMHEVKGFWEDDARAKFKIAGELHPYQFVAITRVKGCWQFERI